MEREVRRRQEKDKWRQIIEKPRTRKSQKKKEEGQVEDKRDKK